MMTQNKFYGMLLCGLYFISIDWLCLSFADVVYTLTEIPFDSKEVRYFRIVFRILASIDSIAIILNAFDNSILSKLCFDISKNYTHDEFVSWHVIYNIGFITHSVLDYIISIYVTILLIKKTITAPSFFRKKYSAILFCFILVMFFNWIFQIFPGKYRFSILTYAFLSIIVNYQTLYLIPKEINTKIKNVIANNLSNAILCFDINKRCIFMNKNAKLFFPNSFDVKKLFKRFDSLEEDFICKREILVIKNEERILDITFQRLRDSKNRNIGVYITLDDITDEENRLEQEKYRSTHDLLTDTLNRKTFYIQASQLLQETPNIPRYFVCTNIRNFKLINDIFGDKFGDKVIKTEAQILQNSLKGNFLLGRVSGDKFAFIIERNLFFAEDVVKISSEIQKATNNLKYKLLIDIGIYDIQDSFESPNSMYDKAMLAIQNKKNDYGQMLSFYDSLLMEQVIKEKQIVSAFDNAITEKQFCMYLQPQVSSKTEKVVGAEALVRWIHPKDGMIPPGEFVPALEKAGFIYKLDNFIWEEAAKKLSEWKKQNIDLYIAVNISAKDFYYLDLYKIFTELVEKYDISPKKLKLEITETVLMHDMKMHSAILTQLQEYGFFIEMDDFGSGYSSLNMLKNIKMDVLKIDMAFLKKTENWQRSQTILNSIIKMAKALGMTIITEGVEEEKQAKILTEFGSDIFQGYFYSKPISTSEFEEKYISGGEK